MLLLFEGGGGEKNLSEEQSDVSSSCRGRENQYYPLGSNQCHNAVCFHVAGKIPQGWREGKAISLTKILLDELQLGSASSSGPRQPTVLPWARLLFPSDLGRDTRLHQHLPVPLSARWSEWNCRQRIPGLSLVGNCK